MGERKTASSARRSFRPAGLRVLTRWCQVAMEGIDHDSDRHQNLSDALKNQVFGPTGYERDCI